MLRQVAQERPGALATETDFVDYMVVLYRRQSQDRVGVESLNEKCVETLSTSESPNKPSDSAKLLKPGAGEPVL
jgi:hypothetical protein